MHSVDHVFITTESPERAFRALTEELKLPVAWPLQDYGYFASGGVSLGNLNLEIIRLASKPAPEEPGQLNGIALSSTSLEQTLKGLSERGAAHGEPFPFKDGEGTLQWTNLTLTDLTKGGVMVFVCVYAFDVSARQAQCQRSLLESEGGPLGLREVAEILVEAPDVTEEARRWQAALGVTPREELVWELPAGPRVRLVGGERARIQLVARVASVTAAQEALAHAGLSWLPLSFLA
jgi:hypothetical protein